VGVGAVRTWTVTTQRGSWDYEAADIPLALGLHDLRFGDQYPDDEVLGVTAQPSPRTAYAVSWRIEVDAHSPREAAEAARHTQRSPLSWAVVFDVTAPDGTLTTVDLLEEGEGP